MLDRLGGDFLQWLRGFYYVMTLGSISAAAQQMGLRQPTVSHQVQMLESELGVQLFQRAPRRMIPTREGLALYERAIGVFEQIREIKAEVGRGREGGVKGEICLVTTHSVAANYLPPVIHSFKARNPETFFTVTAVTEAGFIINKVLSSAIELGIALGQGFPPAISAEPLFSSPLALIVSKKHAARNGWTFKRDSAGNLADLSDLARAPYVAFSPETGLSHYVQAMLAAHQVSLNVALTVNTSMLVVRYAELGFGVSIIDAFTAVGQSADAFDLYPLASLSALRSYQLITRKKSYLSPQVLAFMQHLRTEPVAIPGILPAAAKPGKSGRRGGQRAAAKPAAADAGTS
jgi:DNA-binding transcriptional LysR family regulator